MLKKNLATLFVFGGIFLALSSFTYRAGKGKEVEVDINTTVGKIVVKLYNQTPKTRDNFIKLVKKGFYDSTLFHRVIQQFMIQGGDPASKHAKPGQLLGNGDVGYTVAAEFDTALFHKRGALAMARQGDDVNPAKASSGCQFYIVQGRVFTNAQLDEYEQRMNMAMKEKIFLKLIDQPKYTPDKKRFTLFEQQSNIDSLRALSQKFAPVIDSSYNKMPHFKFTAAQRKAYTTIGGVPHLDGNYTVFGEVVQGMDVVDKIAAVKVDKNNRPLKDVRILSMKIVK